MHPAMYSILTTRTFLTNTPPSEVLDRATAGESTGPILNIDIGAVISSLNYFALAWCIFYALILVSDFFFYRVLYTNLELGRMRRGEQALINAAKIWLTYLLVAFAYLFYTLIYESRIADLFGMFVATGYILKLLFDIPLIPVLSELPNKLIDGFKGFFQAIMPSFLSKNQEK